MAMTSHSLQFLQAKLLKKTALTFGQITDISAQNLEIFQLRRLTYQKILSFISIRVINPAKMKKKVYYTDVFIILQIMPLAQQPKNINDYQLKDDEVKILRPRYDVISGDFLGNEYCVAVVTVRNDPQEQFFDYGYTKDNAKVLLSTHKLKIPSSFKSTIFGQHRMQYEGGAFDDKDF